MSRQECAQPDARRLCDSVVRPHTRRGRLPRLRDCGHVPCLWWCHHQCWVVHAACRADGAQITFTVGSGGNSTACPAGFTQVPVNLKTGTTGDAIYACYTEDRAFGAPYSAITAVYGDTAHVTPNKQHTACRIHARRALPQRIHAEPAEPQCWHLWRLHLPVLLLCGAAGSSVHGAHAAQDYEAGVNDVEGLYAYLRYVTSNAGLPDCSAQHRRGCIAVRARLDVGRRRSEPPVRRRLRVWRPCCARH